MATVFFLPMLFLRRSNERRFKNKTKIKKPLLFSSEALSYGKITTYQTPAVPNKHLGSVHPMP